MKLVWRQSVTAWSQDPDFPNRLPTRHVEVQLRGGTGSVLDKCEVTFGGYALMPTPIETGRLELDAAKSLPVHPPRRQQHV